jgi:hypothetical protein
MPETPRNDDVWRKLFRAFPDKPLRAALGGGGRPAAPAPAWAAVRAQAANLLSDPREDWLSPALAAVLRSWAPDVAAEVTSGPGRKSLLEVFGRCGDRLRSLPADALDAHSVLDAVERELQEALLTCGDRTAEVLLFAGARTTGGSPPDREATPQERRQAVVAFLGWVSAKLQEAAATE